jgi:hypothetical protein
MVNPKSMRRLGGLLGACALAVPLACSAASNSDGRIDGNDAVGGAGAAGSTSVGGASGTASGGATSFGAMPAVDPNANSNGGVLITGGVEMRGTSGDGCTKDQNILFLIDRSGSMQCNPPPTTESRRCEIFPTRADTTLPSKLEIVEDALSTAFNQLLPTMANQPVTRAGLHYFSTDDTCAVNTDPLVPINQVSQPFLDQMRTAMKQLIPNGTTPIVNGLTAMYQYLGAQTLPGDKHVILVTDGADTCTDRQGIADLIQNGTPKALQAGVRTWVIGAPGSENARSTLSQIAKAGGTGKANCDVGSSPTTGTCHYDMTQGDFATTFAKALQEILAAVQCGIR